MYQSSEEYFADHPEEYDQYVDEMAELYSEVIDYPEDWVMEAGYVCDC